MDVKEGGGSFVCHDLAFMLFIEILILTFFKKIKNFKNEFLTF